MFLHFLSNLFLESLLESLCVLNYGNYCIRTAAAAAFRNILAFLRQPACLWTARVVIKLPRSSNLSLSFSSHVDDAQELFPLIPLWFNLLPYRRLQRLLGGSLWTYQKPPFISTVLIPILPWQSLQVINIRQCHRWHAR